MNIHKPLLFVFLLLVILVFACKETNETPHSLPSLQPDIIHKIDSIGQAFHGAGGVMGIRIAVAKQGEIVYNNGFGYIDPEGSIPVTAENYFLLASVSKLVGSAMVHKLVEEKQLSLDQTLQELLPDFPNEDQGRKILLKHLLSHTSGLKDYADVIDSVYQETRIDPTLEDYYHFFQAHELDFEPGTSYNYSNSGFILMAMIIEKVTGNTFENELDRIINQPTGLRLKLIAERASDERTSSIFEFEKDSLIHIPHWTWIKGDGGMTATSGDLVLFPFYWSDGTIISETSFEDMCTPYRFNDGVSTGYGMAVRTGEFEGEFCVGHTGGNRTTMAVMKYYPELKTSVAVMVNTDNTPADALLVEGYVSLALQGKQSPNLEQMEITDFDADQYLGEYQTYKNRYYGSGNQSMVQYPDDPHLYRKRSGSDSKGQKLFFLGDHSFGYESFPMDRLIFETDTSGNVAAFNTYWNGLRKGRFYRK
ncbi:MAG: class A beta-lactamase-related serine hydrolase [Bacteroidetes bacterium]|nr:MAG: class A beta-lactamase-related serine hydrolase [Bacteroidota bacterium]